MVDTSLSRYFKNRLKERGLTQTRLAKAVGVSKQAVGKWMRGGTVEDRWLPKIADFLGADLDELMSLKVSDALEGQPLQLKLSAGHIKPHHAGIRARVDGSQNLVVMTPYEYRMLGKIRRLAPTEQVMFEWLMEVCTGAPKSERYAAWERSIREFNHKRLSGSKTSHK